MLKLFFVSPKKSYKRNATKGLSRPLETCTRVGAAFCLTAVTISVQAAFCVPV